MKNWLFTGTSAFLVLFALAPVEAQTGHAASNAVVRFDYDAQQEQVFTGTVTALLPKTSLGALPGSHLLLTTLNGPVDVSLGVFALQGKGALPASTGQQIRVIGVMKEFRGKQVILARAVTVHDRTYAIRNEHGVPVTPKARERASDNEKTQETQ